MDEIKQQMIHIGRKLYDKGLVVATEGNMSCRLSDERILVTASGVCKGELTPADLVVVDLAGKMLHSNGGPSTEMQMHLEVYRSRPDVKAVIHAHPPYCISLTLAGVSLDRPFLPESVLLLGSVPTTQYGRPSTEQIPQSIRAYIEKTDSLILHRHGSLTVGKTLTEAYHKLEVMENTAKIIWLAKQVGPIQPLDKSELDELLKLREQVYRMEFPILPFKKFFKLV